MFSMFRPHIVRVTRVQTRTMATEKELKKRITSVESIKKITKASKMVAAAKLRGVQNMLMVGRKFSSPVINVWKSEEDKKAEAGEAAKRANDKNYVLTCELSPDMSTMLVPMTSDRGLCGGINSSVVRVTRRIADENEERPPSVLCLGERGRSALSRSHGTQFNSALVDISKQVVPTFEQAMAVASIFLQQKFDTAFLISNRFKSAIAYDTTLQEVPSIQKRLAKVGQLAGYEFEGDETITLTNLAEFSTAVTFYHAMLENNTTEQSQKMSAMENSTKNAGELIESLKIEYNRSRQARITTELIEIISGAAALD